MLNGTALLSLALVVEGTRRCVTVAIKKDFPEQQQQQKETIYLPTLTLETKYEQTLTTTTTTVQLLPTTTRTTEKKDEKYFKNKYLSPRSPTTTPRTRTRRPLGQQDSKKTERKRDFASSIYLSHLVEERGLATCNNNHNRTSNNNNNERLGVISKTSDQTWKRKC